MYFIILVLIGVLGIVFDVVYRFTKTEEDKWYYILFVSFLACSWPIILKAIYVFVFFVSVSFLLFLFDKIFREKFNEWFR